MKSHEPLAILLYCQEKEQVPRGLLSYLESMSHVRVAVDHDIPSSLDGIDVVVSRSEASAEIAHRLDPYVRSGRGWLALVPGSQSDLPPLFGAQPGPTGPVSEIRVVFRDGEHPMAVRLPDAVYLTETYRALQPTDDASDVLLYADWHYQHSPVLVSRRHGEGRTACTVLESFEVPAFQQILYRLLLLLAGRTIRGRDLEVGLLGYAPSVGKLHGLGVRGTPGLALRAACDLDPGRLQQATSDFPGLATHADSKQLADDPELAAVIVATPPNNHARLCLEMMDAGKHVVCEKPLALSRRETDELTRLSQDRGVHLSCHQNRRWDVDYLAIRQALREGRIGEPFYLETFVGGFSHPCGYWHSHAPVSGGTAYDWGGHYLDWIVSLIPERVSSVVGTRHKRVWHDVTNADQERVQVRFAGGQEAEFLHSDIAATRKPKWYLLGTSGAILGQWEDVAVFDVDPVHYYRRHEIPATEMVPALTLLQRSASGQVVAQELPLPPREAYPFHRNLADHLLTGEPITAPLEDSVRVVAILEAASRSADKGGVQELLDA
jgi:predicted dehydrogenase